MIRCLERPDESQAFDDALLDIRERLTPTLAGELVSILRETAVPPTGKRALLEVLRADQHIGDLPSLLDAVFEHLHTRPRVMDEYRYACTATLRFLRIPQPQSGPIADLARGQLRDAWGSEGPAGPIAREIFRESLLVLGSYGSSVDLSVVLQFLHMDGYSHQYTHHLMESLRRLLVLNATQVTQQNLAALHRDCKVLLKQWAAPHVVRTQEMFERCSRIIETLCARLAPEDLDIALTAVRASAYPLLASVMLDHIESARQSLARAGFQHLAARQDHGLLAITKELTSLSRPKAH